MNEPHPVHHAHPLHADPAELERSRARARRAGCVMAGLGLVVLLVLAAGVWGLSRYLGGEPADYPGPGTGSVEVEVMPGDSATAIGVTLADAGVVASTEAFVAAAAADERSRLVAPGLYALRLEMSAAGALEALLDPASRVENVVAIPEGLRADQVVGRLSRGTGVAPAEFDAVLAKPRRLALPRYAEGDPEGFLFPATYTFQPDATAEQMLRALVARFEQAAAEIDLVARAGDAGYTPREIVTIASLAQAEVAERDFGKAVRVVANRLVVGMPLQFDSTVNFALKESDLTLTNDQLAVESPYNTYKYGGLPPGPINSPGVAALEAALDPPEGSWLYFVALEPGSDATRFTDSYEEFLRFKADFYAAVP